MKIEQDVECPHCGKHSKIELEQPEQLSKEDILETLKQLQPAKPGADAGHKHKTADDFLDCPECRLWFDHTATRYDIHAKAPEPAVQVPAVEPAPEPSPEPEPQALKKFGSFRQ